MLTGLLLTAGRDNNVSLLPDVAYPDIYDYLIETPKVNLPGTNLKHKAYKSLESYNFFVSGYVQDVYISAKLT